MADKQRQLFSYTVLDNDYQNPSLKFILGEKGGTTGALHTLETNPADSGIPFPSRQVISGKPFSQDPVLFSFLYGSDVRMLVANIITEPPDPSLGTTYSLVTLPREAGAHWSVLARNILLTTDGRTGLATNPHGVAQVGNYLYIIDYDTQNIYQLGTNELNGAADGNPITLANAPFDVGSAAGLDTDARGQGIIAVKEGEDTFLYALYLVSDAAQSEYQNSVLVKLSVGTGGSLAYEDTVEDLGKNAQELVLVTYSDDPEDHITLLVPAIGGKQQYGTTNGEDSNITAIDLSTLEPRILLTGDSNAASITAYDLRTIAASPRVGNDGLVYIFTGYYDTYGVFMTWAVYRTTVGQLLALTGQTISLAVASGALTLVEEVEEDGAGYFWDLFYELGDNEAGDRLWFARGTAVEATLARDYTTPSAVNWARGMGAGKIGNANMNSADLTSEMIRQVRSGVSYKHGLRMKPEDRKAALRAALKNAAEDEERK
jgi:hypothetical protein